MKHLLTKINDLKKTPWPSFFIIWIFVCTVGCLYRLYPLLTHISYDAKEKVFLSIINNLTNDNLIAIEKEFPNLPGVKKRQIAQKRFYALLKENAANIRKRVYKLARELDKNNPAEYNFPYLLGADSYYHYELTQRIQETGSISDTFKGSKYFNKLMLAPLGHWEPFTLHPYVGYYVHKIISLFKNDVHLMYSISFTPLIIMCLSLIPFLFICSFFNLSAGASFVGSIYLILAKIYLVRSSFGWYDNDPYNVLFPLIILAFFLFGLSEKRSRRSLVITGMMCALSISLYSLFWHGWVFIGSILIICAIAILICNSFVLLTFSQLKEKLKVIYSGLFSREKRSLYWSSTVPLIRKRPIKQKNNTKNLSLYFFIISFGTFLGICVIFGIDEFFLLFKEGFTALKGFIDPPASLWPNLYIEVRELEKAPLGYIIDITGGHITFFIALLGLFAHITKAVKQPKKTNPFMIITFAIFLLCSIFVALGAHRFILLCLIPLSILLALGIQDIFDFIKKFISKKSDGKKHRKYMANAAIILFSLFLLTSLSINAYKLMSRSLLNQTFDDTWRTALERIEQKTPPESIINTWWSFGHFIKAIARRRVTFDGATINVPQAYWFSNVLLAQDEKKALGILRMLNNSGNLATEYLLGSGLKLSDAVDLLKKITPVNKQQAKIILRSKLNNDQINALLELTHKIPPPSYLLLYGGSFDAIIQLAFFGRWNFKEIEEINKDPAARAKYLTSGEKNYLDTGWRLAGGAPKYHSPFPALSISGSKISFDRNIVIDTKNMRASTISKRMAELIPYSLFYLKNDNFMEKKFYNASLPYSMMLFYKSGKPNCLCLDTSLARSMMIRMYFFDAKGLKHIHPVIKEYDHLYNRTEIHVYKVDWAGFLAEIGEEN